MKKIIILIVFYLITNQLKSQGRLPSIIEKVEHSVFLIETFSISGVPLTSGTGFFIDDNGTGISNFHIFKGAYKAHIKTKNLETYELTKIISSSEELDLVIFKIENIEKNSFLPINKVLPKKGENIFTIGNPIGLNWSVSQGIVSGIREYENINLIQITAPLSSGNSGSPIINDSGEVIGIATFILEVGQNLNFGLHIGTLDSINSNDLLTYKTQFETTIPNNYDIAKQHIDNLHLSIHRFDSEEEFENVIKQIDNFIKVHPQSPHGYMRKADTFMKAGLSGIFYKDIDFYMNEALKFYSKAIEFVTNDPEAYYRRGDFLSQWSVNRVMKNEEEKKIRLAISDYKKYASFSEANADFTNSRIAYLYNEINDKENAILYQTKYIESIKPNTSNYERDLSFAYRYRASLYWSANNFDKALIDYNKAIDISPTCDNYLGKAYFLIDNEKYEEASSIFLDECLFKYEHYYYKSLILIKIGGDINRAQYFIEKALIGADELLMQKKIDISELSEYEHYYHLAAVIYDKQENYVETIKTLNKLIQINPALKNDFDIQLWMADTKFNLKDYLGALKEVNLLIEKRPKHAYLFNLKGMILSDLNDKSGSIASYSKAIELEPNNSFHYIMRGYSKFDLNDKAGACEDWSQAGSLGYYRAYDLIKKYCN